MTRNLPLVTTAKMFGEFAIPDKVLKPFPCIKTTLIARTHKSTEEQGERGLSKVTW